MKPSFPMGFPMVFRCLPEGSAPFSIWCQASARSPRGLCSWCCRGWWPQRWWPSPRRGSPAARPWGAKADLVASRWILVGGFKHFLFFHILGNWPIFFRWVETTNQNLCFFCPMKHELYEFAPRFHPISIHCDMKLGPRFREICSMSIWITPIGKMEHITHVK